MMFLTLKALLHFFPLIIIDKCFSFIVIVWKLFPKKYYLKKMTVELRFICKVRTAADSREVFYIVLFCFIFLFFLPRSWPFRSQH